MGDGIWLGRAFGHFVLGSVLLETFNRVFQLGVHAIRYALLFTTI
jgi:hypothetical protein